MPWRPKPSCSVWIVRVETSNWNERPKWSLLHCYAHDSAYGNWGFVRQRVREKTLTSIMKTMKQKAGLDTNKRLTNHSARKYLVQKLKDNNVEDTDIMQISGHKSVQSVKNYSAISEGKHKRISNVLAGADSDNSRAFVPIQTTNSSLDQRITSNCSIYRSWHKLTRTSFYLLPS